VHECSKFPTVPAEIRTTAYATCGLLTTVSTGTASTNRLAVGAQVAAALG